MENNNIEIAMAEEMAMEIDKEYSEYLELQTIRIDILNDIMEWLKQKRPDLIYISHGKTIFVEQETIGGSIIRMILHLSLFSPTEIWIDTPKFSYPSVFINNPLIYDIVLNHVNTNFQLPNNG